jgi:hypothetical protein
MPAAADNPTVPQKTVRGSPDDSVARGLTSDEARVRLAKFGPNAMPDTAVRPLRMALAKFWAPVPWMLEAAVILQIALHEYVEAAVIAGLLVFNAALGFFQEGRAQATLAALKSRLALSASVRRDGVWKVIPAAELVPGDAVKLSLGGVVAADVKLVEGSILLDQSMLTGESVPIEAGPGLQTYAGALVRRGEATAIVTATGASTNSSAPPMSKVLSKKQSCAWCEILRSSMASSLACSWRMPMLAKCRLARLSRSFSRLFWRPSPSLCPPRLRSQRRWAQRPWRAWVCFQRDCLLWTRRQHWTFFAQTKRAR